MGTYWWPQVADRYMYNTINVIALRCNLLTFKQASDHDVINIKMIISSY